MSWNTVRLGDVATFINGFPFKPSDWSNEGLEIIRIQNLTKGASETNCFKGEIPGKYKVQKGDILISWSATLDVFVWERSDAWLNQHIFKVVFDKMEINQRFFIYLIKHILDDMKKEVHGATMQHITKGRFDNLKVPIPPLKEQKRIAEILDTANVLQFKDKELLKKYGELAEAVFYDMFGDPVKNEKGWRKTPLENLSKKIGSGSTPKGGNENYQNSGISLIRSLNIYNGKFKYKNLAHIDDDQAKALNNVTLETNDVLLNITGASVARCCIVPEKVLPARVNQHVSIIRCKKGKINPQFLGSLLIFSSYQEKLLEKSKCSGATREALTKADLKNLMIVVPPLSLQNDFADIIMNIEEQKVQAEKVLQENENLYQRLMQDLFRVGKMN